MRPIWSGALSFGLINIPVHLYSAIHERGINLDMLHKKDLSPIRFAKMCKAEEREVPYEEIVKGYQYEKGEYIVISEDDFIRASPKKTKTIEIQCFIEEEEVDPIYFDKPYFLEPDKGSAKVYLLLHEALKKSKKVGVGTYILHTKEHLGLLKPHGRGIILQQLRYQSELRNLAEIELPIAKIQPKELDIAIKLIDQLTEPFHPEKFKDTYTEEIKAVIAEKTKGKKTRRHTEETEFTPVQDIMKQLKASLIKSHPGSSRSLTPRRRRVRRA